MRPSPLVLAGLAALLSSCAASPCMASPTDATVLLPWGDGAIALAHLITAFLVPLAITAATAAVARIAGPLQVLITTSLVERLVP
ncbi:hypothetical protein MBTS_19825, partial [Methylobacterium bullatum]|nr:hypothetical protein [Methylobacterium bullatum]